MDPPTNGPGGGRLLPLTVGALGVVYGDLGTSPLYSLRATFGQINPLVVNSTTVLGSLSIIVWALLTVVTIKYITVVFRADNHGEGGILALTSLVAPTRQAQAKRSRLVVFGLIGAALLYGDGAITPAISVLSAVEGLEIAAPQLTSFVVPIASLILVGLFSVQRFGSGRVGKVFGPVMVVWFVVIALLGLASLVNHPSVLAAVNPLWAVRFFAADPRAAFVALGSIFLVLTGAEALYADMGHFGPRAIRFGWYSLVLPALLLNYFGQGALLLEEPGAAINPFFRLAPQWSLYPLIGLATFATVIASQSLITGVFSLTHQAIQFGYAPRMEVRHTSAEARGQVYLPLVNWLLLIVCLGLVLGFRNSSNLAGAFGVAVTSTMFITTVLLSVYARDRWNWGWGRVTLIAGVFLLIDLAFLSSNLLKIPQGGWFPLLLGAGVFFMLTTWRKGRQTLARSLEAIERPAGEVIANLTASEIVRVEGTAVYLFQIPGRAPPAFLANLRHNKVLHETVVFLVVKTEEIPRVPRARRDDVTQLAAGFFQVILSYGFMEQPDVAADLEQLVTDVSFAPEFTTYFMGEESLLSHPELGLHGWRERLFRFMHRNARDAADYFRLPVDRLVHIGLPVEI